MGHEKKPDDRCYYISARCDNTRDGHDRRGLFSLTHPFTEKPEDWQARAVAAEAKLSELEATLKRLTARVHPDFTLLADTLVIRNNSPLERIEEAE